VRVLQLDVRDDQLLIERVQAGKRGAIGRVHFARDRPIERRRIGIDERFGKRLRNAAAADAPMLVSNSVPDRLAQVGRQGAPSLRLEGIKSAEGSNNGVVNQICGVGDSPRPARQAAVRPAPEARDVAIEKIGERFARERRVRERRRYRPTVCVRRARIARG